MAGFGDGREGDEENHYRQAAMFHPLRQRIGRVLTGGVEASAGELASELGHAQGVIAYHLRILVKRGVLRVVPRRRPRPPLYRWSEDARWAQEMLVEEDE